MAKYKVHIGDQDYVVEIVSIDADGLRVRLNDNTYVVSFDEMNLEVERPQVKKMNPDPIKLPVPEKIRTSTGEIFAPIPGDVIAIEVMVGDQVVEGDVLVILESMKMKNMIRTSRAGHVKKIAVQIGQSVAYGETLVELEIEA